ncbi:MAG: DUF805 domain-containing protein [Novosphingobium sp.]
MTEGPPEPGPLDTVRRTFSLAGRSERSELITYLFASLLVSIPVSFLTALTLERELHVMIVNALTVLLAIPVPALLVRRYHDSGRSGAWVWLAVFGFAVWLGRTTVSTIWGVQARLQLDGWIWLIDWLLVMANLASVLLALLPGTAGPNRFGPDPRHRET